MHSISLPSVLISIIAVCGLAQVSFAASDPASSPCPDLDGSSFADATGSSYHIQCNIDYPGNDLPSLHTDTFAECLKACDSYVPGSSAEAHDFASCVGVSWGAGNHDANCYLKYNITTTNHQNVGFSSGFYSNYTLPGSGGASPGSTSSTTTSASVTSSTPGPTSTTAQPTPAPSSGSDSHGGIGVGAGVGVGVGVVVGFAILAGIFFFVRRRSKRRPAEPVELDAETNVKDPVKKSDGFSKPPAEKWLDELPSENKPLELSDPRGPRAELSEIRDIRAEMG